MSDAPENIVPITREARRAAETFVAEHNRELHTILFTDLVDSTQLQSELGNVESARLTELHRKIVRNELAMYDAREIEWAGDSCLAVFSKPSDAVVFSLRMQAEHHHLREAEPKLPMVRVGLHLGEIVVRHDEDSHKDDLFGLQVSETARIMSLARAGQIYCSRAVLDSARSSLTGHAIPGIGEIAFANHGGYMLKGVPDSVEICEVLDGDLVRPKPPEANDKCRKLATGPWRFRHAVPGIAVGGAVALAAFVATLNNSPDNAPEETRAPNEAAPVSFTPAPQPQRVRRMSLSLPYDQTVSRPGLTSYTVAFSPDGGYLAYVATDESEKVLALRSFESLRAELMNGTEGARNPFFSPDGQWIGFFTQPGGELKKVSARGGKPIALCKAPLPLGAYWDDDGFITFASRIGAGLMRVHEDGGTPEPLTSLDRDTGEIVHMFPAPLPGGEAVIITTGNSPQLSNAQVEVIALESGDRTIIAQKAVRGRYVSTGHIVYVQAGAFMAVPFSPETLEVTGPPVDVTEDRMTSEDWAPRQFEFSDEGSLVFVPHEEIPADPNTVLWVDRQGVEEIVAMPPRPYFQLRLSPDDSLIANRFEGPDDIWIFDPTLGTNRRFTDDEADDRSPVWSPDGQTIAFSSTRETQVNIYLKRVYEMGEPEKLFTSPQIHYPYDWTAEGNTIIFQTQRPDTGLDIGMVSVDGDREPQPLVTTRYSDIGAAVSHDGQWLAFMSDGTGQFEVYVKSLRGTDQPVQISPDGGKHPLWNPTKNELIYRDKTYFVAVDVGLEDGLTVSEPRILFRDTFAGANYSFAMHDIARDGERLLLVREPDDPSARAHATGTELIVVQNWFEVLRNLEANVETR